MSIPPYDTIRGLLETEPLFPSGSATEREPLGINPLDYITSSTISSDLLADRSYTLPESSLEDSFGIPSVNSALEDYSMAPAAPVIESVPHDDPTYPLPFVGGDVPSDSELVPVTENGEILPIFAAKRVAFSSEDGMPIRRDPREGTSSSKKTSKKTEGRVEGAKKRREMWSPEENALLEKFSEKGPLYIYKSGFLPGRGYEAIKTQLFSLGFCKRRNKKEWTPDEDAIVKEYAQMNAKKLYRLGVLPGRSRGEIEVRMYELLGSEKKKGKFQEWTPDDEALLVTLKDLSTKEIFEGEFFPGRSEESIKKRRSRMGLVHKRVCWGKIERAALEAHRTLPAEEIDRIGILPKKNLAQIKAALTKLDKEERAASSAGRGPKKRGRDE